jgi:hypothetical protein
MAYDPNYIPWNVDIGRHLAEAKIQYAGLCMGSTIVLHPYWGSTIHLDILQFPTESANDAEPLRDT